MRVKSITFAANDEVEYDAWLTNLSQMMFDTVLIFLFEIERVDERVLCGISLPF